MKTTYANKSVTTKPVPAPVRPIVKGLGGDPIWLDSKIKLTESELREFLPDWKDANNEADK